MDGAAVRKIHSQLRYIQRERARLEQERQPRPTDETPAPGNLGHRLIQQRLRLEVLVREEAILRRQALYLGSTPSSSSSRSTGSAPRVRQSALYSGRRRPRGRQGRPVEEGTADVSSSEPGHTNTDLSRFEALTLNTTPPTLESSDRSAGSAPRVRQSVLYSTRRGPRGRQGRPVEEGTADVSSGEPGHTNTDLSRFEALTLNTTPPTLESSDSVVEHPTELSSTERGPTSVNLSNVEGLSVNVTSATETTDGTVMHAGDMESLVPDSTNAKQPAVREGLSPRSQEMWLRIDQYLAEHTFDDMWEGMVAMKNGFCNPPKKVPFPTKKSPKKLALPVSLPSPHGQDAQSLHTKTQCGESTKQITENGKQWMKEEVMEAFKKYMKETNRLKGIEFQLDKLLHQCLSVETYEKIFHHYNFTVKTKQAGSDKWSSALYFAQVKEMYGRKSYFCYPLDPFEDGFCHACKNQGMDALKHPAVPVGYETGQADTACPFFVDDSDDDDRVPDDEGMAWAFSQVFFGGAPY